ncbi:hypothetical protein Tco_1379378 [Tanacetum coccineum]
MLAICSVTEPVVFKAPKPSSNAERVPQGTNLGAKPRHKKHSTSSKQPPVSIKEATKASFIIHSESASGNDASAVSTAKADFGNSAPNQTTSISEGLETILTQPITGKRASSISRQVEEEEASSIIKLEDIAKLVSNEDKVHATTNAETKDTLVPKSSSPKSSQIQELTNQVLILQSQKHKLELEKNKAEAEAALLKALPFFPNMG